ncbi:MAG: MurR/RpiR family transcriptional regulator [Candidatus Puniceispirillaceae bacterium]
MDDVSQLLDALGKKYDKLSPQLRVAARYVMDNPHDVSISSVRALSHSANVKPNSFVRLARELGYDGYDEFRELFRDEVRKGPADFPDRVRWLQSIQKKGELSSLYAAMVGDALSNLEQTFAGIDETELASAARAIWQARKVYIMGVGVNYANASNFTYLASTGMNDFVTIPRPASTAIDDLARADSRDMLIAITMRPYRNEVLEAVQFAKSQGVQIVGLSDTKSAPVITQADYGFMTHIDTSQFFPSSVSIIALLETLLSFVIAGASDEIVDRVDRFHQRRHDFGYYQEDK